MFAVMCPGIDKLKLFSQQTCSYISLRNTESYNTTSRFLLLPRSVPFVPPLYLTRNPTRDTMLAPDAPDSTQGRATVVSSAQEAQEHRQPGPSSNTGGDERGGSSATATARDQRQPTGTTSGGSHVDATSAPRSGRSGGREQEQHEQDIIETSQQSGSKRATNASPAPDDRRRADRPTGGDKATKRARKSAPKRPPVEPPSVNGTQGATSATGPLPNVDKAQPSQTGIACDDGGGDDDDSAKNGTIDPMPVDAGANRACGARRETGACAAPGPAGDGEGVSTQGSGGGGEGGGEAARGCCGGGVEGGGEAARGCSGGGGSRSGRGRGADGGSGGRDVDVSLLFFLLPSPCRCVCLFSSQKKKRGVNDHRRR